VLRRWTLLLAIAAPATATSSATSSAARWRAAMPAADLAGWRRMGGQAGFTVAGGELIGRAVPGRENSWLVSNRLYGDFILEFEAKTDPALNSGLMIRGQSRADYRSGAVHGYQIEIDPSPRGWSGGLYDEQRRQWLYTLGRNPAARAAYRRGDWNRYRVEAIGQRLRTFINGVPAADIVDDTDARGFLAFQVHAIPDADAARAPEVRFRALRMITDAPARHALPETGLAQQGWLANRLGAGERRDGWTLLWDGRTTGGWRPLRGDAPVRGWSAADGVLAVSGRGGGGDIATARRFRDFELSVDFRLTPGANSGIKYYPDPAALSRGTALAPEYQLLDDDRHPDAKMGRDGNRTLGSLYDLIAARNLSDPQSPGKRVNPPGEWNRAVIVARGGRVEHWLNGFKVVEYDRGSPAFRAAVAGSKFAGQQAFGTAPDGPIVLQDHGDRVDFRSIKIRAR
jgi:hypothetical protein